MAKKETKEVVQDIMDVDFEDTSKSKMIDDDGYEEGKSKDREMVANADTLGNYTGGILYKGKVKDYPGAKKLLEKKKPKVIPLNPDFKKKG